MKYYRLKESAIGYPDVMKGRVFPENYRHEPKDEPVLVLVNEFPNDWDEVGSDYVDSPKTNGINLHGSNEVNTLANKILLRMIPSVMTVNGIVNKGEPLEKQAYDLAVKMNEERIKRGL